MKVYVVSILHRGFRRYVPRFVCYDKDEAAKLGKTQERPFMIEEAEFINA